MSESLDDFRKEFIGHGGRGGTGAVLQSLHEGPTSASVILHQRGIVLLEEDDDSLVESPSIAIYDRMTSPWAISKVTAFAAGSAFAYPPCLGRQRL